MITVSSLLAQGEVPVTTNLPVDPAGVITTPSVDWAALAPLLILGVGALLLLTVTSLAQGKLFRGFHTLATIVIAGAAMVAVLPVWARVQGWDQLGPFDLTHPDGVGPFSTVGGAVGIDGFALYATMIICAAVIMGSLFAHDYQRREGLVGPEFSVLMLLSAVGAVIMAMSNDLIVLFLGLETMSLAVYVLTAMHLRRSQSQEAGLKYFVLGGFSSAFLLYGVAMIYGATGSTSLIVIKDFLAENLVVQNGLLLVGMALMVVGLGFKVAAMPFHAWSPDAYDGAPTPAVVYMAAAVKAGAFAGIVRVFMVALETQSGDWRPMMSLLAVLSMVGGALIAIVQTNVKRMLAYSSISHAGFILVAVSAANPEGVTAILFYLAAYTFMVAGTFGVVALVGRKGDGHHQLEDYRGLAHTNPALSLVFTLFLLAQAGIPFTSGFFAKFLVISAAVTAEVYWIAVLAMVSAVIAAFLYLRLIVSMYMTADGLDDEASRLAAKVRVPFVAGLALAICVVVTLGAGILPDTLLGPAEDAVPVLVEVPTAGSEVPGIGTFQPTPNAPRGS